MVWPVVEIKLENNLHGYDCISEFLIFMYHCKFLLVDNIPAQQVVHRIEYNVNDEEFRNVLYIY
jgi:hypothetical protein